MTSFVSSPAGALSLGILLAAVFGHWRFKPQVIDLAPGILTSVGIFAALFELALGLADFDVAGGQGGMAALFFELRLAVWVLAVGVGAALSIKIRFALWGIPAAYVVDPGPSLRDVDVRLIEQSALMDETLQSLRRIQQSLNGKGEDALLSQLKLMRAGNEHGLLRLNERVDEFSARQIGDNTKALLAMDNLRHLVRTFGKELTDSNALALSKAEYLQQAFEEFAERQAESNLKALTEALLDVVQEFDTRINGHFQENLVQLVRLVEENVALQDSHLSHLSDAAHHQRRLSEQMIRSTAAFQELIERSSALAAMSDRIHASLDLLLPRQEAIDFALGELAEVAAKSKLAHDSASQRLSQLLVELNQAVQRNGDQVRRHISEQALKGQQQGSSNSKEVGDAIAKTSVVLAQQLGAMSAKFASDIGPMAQQIKKLADTVKSSRP